MTRLFLSLIRSTSICSHFQSFFLFTPSSTDTHANTHTHTERELPLFSPNNTTVTLCKHADICPSATKTVLKLKRDSSHDPLVMICIYKCVFFFSLFLPLNKFLFVFLCASVSQFVFRSPRYQTMLHLQVKINW